MASNGFSVRWGGKFDRCPAGIGQRDDGAAAVVLAFLAAHQTPPLHPRDVMSEPAARPLQHGAELAGAHPTVCVLRKVAEDVVVRF